MSQKNIRITKLILKNYAPFYESMGIKNFEFDRTNSKNNLVLILGSNGSGKSFLLTELSPEPTEHIIGRTSNRYIKNEEGRKTLTYVISENGNDILEYTCDMIFSADRRKTTCFLTKKDLITDEEVELNPNGNVTSYLEACKVHLGYDKNYKSIGYLSEDMRNLVSMGFTERQQLISNWLPNTSEFLQASKIAQKKKNQTQKEIENLLKDIAKISVGNIETSLKSEEENLVIKNLKLDKVKDGLSKSNLMLSMLNKYTKEALITKKNKFLDDVKKYNESCSKNADLIKKYNKYLKSENGSEQLSNDIVDLDIREEKLIINEQNTNDEILRLTSTIETMNSSVSKTSTSNQYDDLVSVNLALDKNKSDLDLVNRNISDKIKDNEELSKFDKFSPELKTASSSTINALMNIALVSTKISNMCGDYEFKSIFDSKAGDDIVSQIDNIKIINSNLEQQNIEYENQIHNIESGSINYDSLKSYVPSKCGENTCSLIRALIERSSNSSTNKISEIRQNIEINKSKIIENNRLIEEKQRICQNLQNALYDMTQVTDTLKTLDDKTYYLPDSLREEINSPIPYNVLMKCSLLLDESKKYDEYVSLLEKKESIEQTISNLNNISHVLSLSEENKRLLQESIDRRRELTEKLKNIKDELTTISNEKETLLSLKDKVDSLRVDFNNLNLEKDRLIALKKEILEDNECLYNKNIISSCVRKLHELERNLTSDISTITAKIESYKTQMISVETLKSRKTALEVKKDLYELAYNIWSTDGYPSLLINDFLEEVTECTNKDLDSSWGGILNIKKPELESSALKIPVIRGNAELDDVSECSKAEKATLDLAISFGILEVSTIDSKFGIITRIDEKDSGMDVVRRQNFLDLLQERLKTINCINAFCITHSNCFENIEADVILLKNYESVTSENALDNKNIIYRFDKSV